MFFNKNHFYKIDTDKMSYILTQLTDITDTILILSRIIKAQIYICFFNKNHFYKIDTDKMSY